MTSHGFWLRLLAGTALLYALMAGTAGRLGSVRGEWGLIVGAVVVGAALLIERAAYSESFKTAFRGLGLGAPRLKGLAVALLACALLAACLPIAASLTNEPIDLRDGWILLLPGLFAQAGIAEETTFRGFLFGHIRTRHAFWRAVLISIAPFALVHVAMFLTLPWPIAAASLALAIVTCAPLAHLYELCGRTIWAPALLHATIQGAIKIIDFDGALLPLFWIAACAVFPFLVFAWKHPELADNSQQEHA